MKRRVERAEEENGHYSQTSMQSISTLSPVVTQLPWTIHLPQRCSYRSKLPQSPSSFPSVSSYSHSWPYSTCLRSSSAALLGGSPLAEPRALARACCSLACSRASARSLRSLRRGGGGGGGGGSGGAGASLPWVPALGLGLSLVPALLWLLNTREEKQEEDFLKGHMTLVFFFFFF